VKNTHIQLGHHLLFLSFGYVRTTFHIYTL
jgi:hypothetical protein